MRDLVQLLNESEYQSALADISWFIDNEPDPQSEDGKRFERLLILIQAYESSYYPISPADKDGRTTSSGSASDHSG
jgi:antitoxin component HigA of HigAB toxin-antitoxin module